jgi:hypothetical protein
MDATVLHQDVTMEDGNHNNENNTTSILTADEFLKIGLQLVGYKKRRIRRAKKRSNVERFLGHYGSIASSIPANASPILIPRHCWRAFS